MQDLNTGLVARKRSPKTSASRNGFRGPYLQAVRRNNSPDAKNCLDLPHCSHQLHVFSNQHSISLRSGHCEQRRLAYLRGLLNVRALTIAAVDHAIGHPRVRAQMKSQIPFLSLSNCVSGWKTSHSPHTSPLKDRSGASSTALQRTILAALQPYRAGIRGQY